MGNRTAIESSPTIADMLRRDKTVGPAKFLTRGQMDTALRDAREGRRERLATGWPTLDRYISLLKEALYIVTGIPSHGKGAWTKALIYNTAIMHRWRWVVYAPEDFPARYLMRHMVELVVGKPTYRASNGPEPMSDDEARGASDFIDRHMLILDSTEEPLGLEAILTTTERAQQAGRVDALLIDPWNQLECTRPVSMTETDWIGAALNRCLRFAQSKKMSVWIVAHPRKLWKLDGGKYPVPDLGDISGSQHWYNRATFGLTVWRDFEEGHTEVHVKKVRFRHYGHPGVVRLHHDPWSGRFSEDGDGGSF